MSKAKTRYICQECGYSAPKWLGRCPGCGAWNSMIEEVVEATGAGGPATSRSGLFTTGDRPRPITEVEACQEERFSTGIGELDRALGGGIVPGSFILVAGDPGIGKSTLMLQMSNHIGLTGKPVLYVSGEESSRQIRLRADRLGPLSGDLFVVAETNIRVIEDHVASVSPSLVIIDSIQTAYDPELESAPGSVSQVREVAARLMRLAKVSGTPIFVVGHVTKTGVIAGPRVLEHMVDTVLYLEGERNHAFRILRAVKNRFGSTNEIGVFEMQQGGLIDVKNPSQIFLSEKPVGVSGSCVVASLEGTRPILVELQALVSSMNFGAPRRTTMGVDYNRVAIILAVLEKRVGLSLAMEDVYVNVVGGIRLDDPAVDLGIATAIASSHKGKAVDGGSIVLGEIGLSGEVRAVSRLEARLSEAAKLGFKRCIIPRRNVPQGKEMRLDMEIEGVATLREALDAAIG
ncbi:MAG TPA: DNA repair protein RadA [Firmicutes bacterium]|nr:DNA repair protein RadA [Bacillota bacterium]